MKDKEKEMGKDKNNNHINKSNEKDHHKHFDENEDDNIKEDKRHNSKRRNVNNEIINSFSKTKQKSFLSQINNFRKENTGLFYFILSASIVLALFIFYSVNCLIKNYCSEKYGYSTQVEYDYTPNKIIPSNEYWWDYFIYKYYYKAYLR